MTACAAYAVIFGIMKITLLQRDIIWADPEANIRRNAQVFRENAGSDLYVFPEMFSTGFCTGPEGVAERLPSVTLEWMKEQASAYGCAIAGSIAIEEDGKYFKGFMKNLGKNYVRIWGLIKKYQDGTLDEKDDIERYMKNDIIQSRKSRRNPPLLAEDYFI